MSATAVWDGSFTPTPARAGAHADNAKDSKHTEIRICLKFNFDQFICPILEDSDCSISPVQPCGLSEVFRVRVVCAFVQACHDGVSRLKPTDIEWGAADCVTAKCIELGAGLLQPARAPCFLKSVCID